ncbi:MAG: bleomycin resistance protein [bacterium]|nr:bleomycin resistance protein [bacterium]
MLLGTVNHISITVSDLPVAMRFLGPILEFLGYESEGAGDGVGVPVVVSISARIGGAFNVWAARPEHASQPFEVYAPGLHHVALNVARHEQVDEIARLVRRLGGEITDGPGEFPYADGGYYAVYFLGPDRIKFEVVHMPELERAWRERALLDTHLIIEDD